MKSLIPTLITLSLGLGIAQAIPAQAQGLPNTDPNKIYGVGSQNNTPVSAKFNLEPGLYELDEIENKWNSDYYLLVYSYINDPQKTTAILFPKAALHGDYKTIGTMYQGRPIKNGTEVMLSPLAIDNSGNLRVQSEVQRDAPVIEVVSRAGDHRYPFVLKGRNGALNGKLLGMRASNNERPALRAMPSAGIFGSTNGTNTQIMVSGDEVSIYSGSLADQSFNLLPINGVQGKFASLTKATFDTMSESSLADERIQRMATFISGCFDREIFMIMTPTINYGEFQLELFKIGEPSFLEWLFPGKRTHSRK